MAKEYSPRMWRWSQASTSWTCRSFVFSTYVEVIPNKKIANLYQISILHVCGGDPNGGVNKFTPLAYSPRMWRWSLFLERLLSDLNVFSTYVEVILKLPAIADSCILHVCGGDPLGFDDSWAKKAVFSTYVEVILGLWENWWIDRRILHVCGGDPDNHANSRLQS